MSVYQQSLREFTISDKTTGIIEHRQSLIDTIDTIPDLTNEELESIVNLQPGYSIGIDTDNITVIRTA